MKYLTIAAISAALLASACSKPDPALVNAPQISYETLKAASYNPQRFEQLLTNTTHDVMMVNGTEYRYLGPNGAAVIKRAGSGQIEKAQWLVRQTGRGHVQVCIGESVTPENIPLVNGPCESREEFLAHFYFFAKGDPLGLAGQ